MTPSAQREENRITKLAIWHSGSVSLSCQLLVAIYFQDFFFFVLFQAGRIQIGVHFKDSNYAYGKRGLKWRKLMAAYKSCGTKRRAGRFSGSGHMPWPYE